MSCNECGRPIKNGGHGVITCWDCKDKEQWLATLQVGDRVHDCLDDCVVIQRIEAQGLFTTDGIISNHRGMECLSPCDCEKKKNIVVEHYLSPFTGQYV
jgi:hypothetical protein